MAARLEIDLLKRSLQPHFLMNTLTTLAQIVEEDPKVAVRLIDDLAFEFRALNAISGLTSIPLARELELCAAHLRVMTVRTERPWRLEVSGIAQEAVVPPALFLTLIENGFSHQRAEGGSTTFSLRAEGTAEAPRYTFFSPGVVGAVNGGREGGMGLRYVRVRLEELWPSRWKLSQQEVTGGWQTVIDLAGPEGPGLAP
jgi:LytS/YehU family sensor histidine kinase